ncbi:hypothetical protein [Campylobacter fetus]|uniref:hypothetical protein n=1 Tax=Campylobacter fetus TaxID=196 RepID=UPI000FCBB47F|nr:hypothetical protein [Campylobacter fetus]RUT51009.1 hypothetical protein BWK67_00355 [Campylobacter fetus]RUT51737.1 hypothetical protein BWK51_00355 [Campylobacter fetus]
MLRIFGFGFFLILATFVAIVSLAITKLLVINGYNFLGGFMFITSIAFFYKVFHIGTRILLKF